MARRPRMWEQNVVYTWSTRIVDRQFLLKPDPEINNIVGVCLGRAQKKYPVQLHWLDTNINHTHGGFSPFPDQLDNPSKFLGHFNGNLARMLNKTWNREGAVWSSRARVEPCVDDTAAETMLFYSAANVAKDGLVERASQWTNFSTYDQLAQGKRQRFRYFNSTKWWAAGGPKCKKPMETFMEWVDIVLTPITSWAHMTESQRQTHFRKRLRKIEENHQEQRKQNGRKAIGQTTLKKLDPRDKPKTPKKGGKQPLCHATTKATRQVFEEKWKTFINNYRRISADYRSGNFDIEFPTGSYRPPLTTIYLSSAL